MIHSSLAGARGDAFHESVGDEGHLRTTSTGRGDMSVNICIHISVHDESPRWYGSLAGT